MSAKRWLTIFLGLFLAILVLIGGLVIYLDPFYHYHAPRKDFYYILADQRYQNDGITRHFTYDAIITGTSMVENFRTSELDSLLGTTSVKIPYPGATFREINDNLAKGFATHDSIRYVIRGLDMSHLVEDASAMRTDMGEYPTYLYDSNVLNDVKYLYNSNVFFQYILPLLARRLEGVQGGVSSFDDYSWSGNDNYSAETSLGGHAAFGRAAEQPGLTPEQKETLQENIAVNVVSIAQAHPETQFLLFFPPYSAAWYGDNLAEGSFTWFLEAEKLAAQQLVACPNVHLFLFSSNTEITTDMNLYKDVAHYSPAVNSWMLRNMAAAIGASSESSAAADSGVSWAVDPSRYEVTDSNLDAMFAEEEEIYGSLDYNTLLEQVPNNGRQD